MSNIRITRIGGVEYVTYKDYLRLKEEKQELEYLGDINEELKEENKKLNIIIENTKIEQKSDREHIEKLEEENQKLKEREKELRIYITGLDQELGRYKNTISDLEDELDVKTREIMRMEKKAREKGWEL